MRALFWCIVFLFPAGVGAFDDISATYPYGDEVNFLKEKNVIQGYGNSFRPYASINRAEFLKIIMESFKGGGVVPETVDTCVEDTYPSSYTYASFVDVPVNAWFADYVCMGKITGLIEGYPDNTFRPGQEISFAEAAKITVKAAGIYIQSGTGPWYSPYIDALELLEAEPRTGISPTWRVQRGEMAYMAARLMVITRPGEEIASRTITEEPKRTAPVNIATEVKDSKSYAVALTNTSSSTGSTTSSGGSTSGSSSTSSSNSGSSSTSTSTSSGGSTSGSSSTSSSNSGSSSTSTSTSSGSSTSSSSSASSSNSGSTSNSSSSSESGSSAANGTGTTSTAAGESTEDVVDPRVTEFYKTGKLTVGNIGFTFFPEDAKKIKDPLAYIALLNKVYDGYSGLVGGKPFNGAPMVFQAMCDYESGKGENTKTDACPYGYLSQGVWGYAGNPMKIGKSGFNSIIQDANNGAVTFGFLHEISHNFDFTPKPQYMFNSASVEAWANLKLVLIMNATGVETVLNGVRYSSGNDLLSRFYRSYYDEYTSKGLSFENLDNNSNIAGNLSDYYLAVLERRISQDGVSEESLVDTLRLYFSHANSMRYIASSQKQERMNQFVYFWSAFAGKDLSAQFEADRFPISEETKSRITEILKLSSSERTKEKIIEYDTLEVGTIPTSVTEAFKARASIGDLEPVGSPFFQDNLWIQPSIDGAGNVYMIYNPFNEDAYLIPWWNTGYLDKENAFKTVGYPKSEYYNSGGTWYQDFENGSLVYPDGAEVYFVKN